MHIGTDRNRDSGILRNMTQSKLPNTNQSIFTTIHQLIAETGAIDVAIGKTDFKCPEELAELAAKYLKDGFNNFAPLEGVLKLREAVEIGRAHV